MPHRCLACLLGLPDGAPLAQGCPRCGGRAFHHSARPTTGPQVRGPQEGEIWTWESRDAWLRNAPPSLPAPAPPDPAEARAAPLAGLKVPTVRFDPQGAIDVDVAALLAENPVIVERDGTYEVDLPGALRPRRRER